MRQLRLAILVLAATAIAAACGSSPSAPLPSAAVTAQASAVAQASPAVSAPAASATAAGAQTIDLSEWKVAVASTASAGGATFAISNMGTAPHELLIFKSKLAPSAYPMKAGNIDEEGAGVKLVSDGDNVDPGGTQSRTVDLAPGTYLFVCNIPGHFRQGMFTVVTVTS